MSLFGMKGDSNSCIKLMFSKINMVLNCFLRAWIFLQKFVWLSLKQNIYGLYLISIKLDGLHLYLKIEWFAFVA